MQALRRQLNCRVATTRRHLAPRVYCSAAYDATEGQTRFGSKYAVYKGKGAMQLKLIGPTWKTMPKGVFLDREGVMFMEFANLNTNAGPQSGYGERHYNWEQKVTFALKPTELGQLLDSKTVDSTGLSLFHDPDKGSPNEGVMKKTLSVKMNADNVTYMFSISVTDRSGGRTSVAVPVTTGELMVIRNLAAFAIPRLLGFDLVAESMHNILPMGPQQQ